MKRLLPIAFAVIFCLFGCQNQQVTNKQAAMQRWGQARAKINIDLARQQFESGQLSKALATASQAAETAPKYIPGHLLLGEILLEQNRLIPAQQCFETCLSLDPSHAQANYQIGIVFEKRQLHDKALEYYRAAWTSEPQHAPYLLAVVETMVAQDHRRQALDLLIDNIGENNVTEPDASIYMVAGNILMSLDDPSEAVLMFRRAVNFEPDNREITESLALALLDAEQPGEAVKLFEKLQQQAQQENRQLDWSYHLAMGDCYLKLGRFHQAQRCFEHVSNHDSGNPAVWTRLSQTALARNDLDTAYKYASRAIAIKPDFVDGLIALAYISFQQRQYSQAEQIIRRAITSDSQNAMAYCLLGRILQAQGSGELAAECYKQALQIEPENSLAKKLMLEIDKTHLGWEKTHDKF